MNRPVRVTAPAELPVTLTEAKAQLRVASDNTDDDTMISALLQATTDHLDGWSGVLGRCLVTQTWSASFDGFSGRFLRLPFPDVTAIASVTYQDADDAEQTVNAASYAIKEDALSAYLFFAESFTIPTVYHRPDAVTVTFTAGYGAASAVPQAIKHAMLMLVSHWYENREAIQIGQGVSEIPMAVDALLTPYRVRRF
jgi:uncharacterized phiE125 gp8 family phage protein